MTDDELGLDSMFPEPPRPPTPEPTFSIYKREKASGSADDWSELSIRLVGTHPLWGHHLWNSARSIAAYLDNHPDLYVDGSVLELGAGGGLPAIVTANNGAENVILTDYPDANLIKNMEFNVDKNVLPSCKQRVSVQGFIWGTSVQPLLSSLSNTNGFNLIILSDLIFNHSQHDALLNTCEQVLLPHEPQSTPSVLVFYTHHRPHLANRDMEFFTKAQSRGWHCEEILTQKFEPMFPDDPGEEEIRATVHGWKLTHP
ncbi:related to Putative nicotinamide N-methyltransferase [Armillaria ostoyae]|uniref:Protein N-terminal and lysine N-methyltransferase EFM7 n=1 Tax=Armillaria ostoyae TaxID=47428 RepID=A0A284R6V2_ARMOS|nr:related to Putative nicotinamide N-methyltransferase [Armillaria ostoyae]